LYTLSPRVLATFNFLKVRRRMPDLKNPKSFDEKLLWLMLYWTHPLKTRCADKYGVRSYVKEHALDHMLPELLGVYENSSEIDFKKLPERFVLKCTHGCGFNIICKEKSRLDVGLTRQKLDSWMRRDISNICGEIHYAGIKPRIICESFLDDLSGEVPVDYKVYCFNGKAHCTMVCAGRGASQRPKFYFYDRGWNNKLPYNKTAPLSNGNIPKPDAYEVMIDAAEKMSKPFPFVRMDFYIIKGKVVIGEMTFTPNGCVDGGYTDIGQYMLGKLINLSPIYVGYNHSWHAVSSPQNKQQKCNA
jgi:hypothetical protein